MPAASRTLGVGSSGDDVSLLQARLLDLGHDIAPAELGAGLFAGGTRLALMAVQTGAGVWASGAYDPGSDTALAAAPDRGTAYAVVHVTDPTGAGAPGLTVRLFDRDLRSETELGRGETDADGWCVIGYEPRRAAELEAGSPDLFARVLAGDELLWDPPVRDTVFNAGRLGRLSVSLPSVRPPRLSEYERVVAAVDPLRGQVPWEELGQPSREQPDGSQDVVFLTGETGLDHQLVEHAVVAHRLAAAHEVPAELGYAVLATGALLDPQRWSTFTPRLLVTVTTPVRELFYDLVLLPWESVEAAVRRAVDTFLVPASTLDALDRVRDLLARHREEAEAHAARERQDAVLGHVQDVLSSDAVARVTALLATDPFGDLTGVLDELFDAGAGIGPGRPGEDRATRLRLADLIGDTPAVLDHLQRRHDIAAPADLPRLATLEQSDWEEAVRAAPGTGTDAATVSRQAERLADLVAARFPGAAVASRLARDPHPPVAAPTEVAAILAGAPEFELAGGNVADLVRAHAAAAGEEPSAQATRGLRQVQRMFKVAPRYDRAAALLRQGVTSAARAAALGRTRFTALAQGSGAFSAAEARTAYETALTRSGAATVLAGQFVSGSAASGMAALSGAPADAADVVADFPTMASLFSLIDQCACVDCRSVHGAAAYLVDVLQFLDHRLVTDTTVSPAPTTAGARDALLAVRPDLGDLDLSCPNTNVEVPYLDLVNELLEEAVRPDPGVPYAGPLAAGIADAGLVALLQAQGWPYTPAAAVHGPDAAGAYVVRDGRDGDGIPGSPVVAKLTPDGAGGWAVRRLRQTTGTAEQIGALPQYVNTAAYATLAGAEHAFGLPFDLPSTEARAYLAQLDLSRADLMAALRTAAGPTDAEVAAERLGLSQAERALVTTPDAGGQQGVWTTAATPAAGELSNVAAFVTRAGIEYGDLLELVDLAWVDGGADLFVRHLDSSCDLAAKEIENLDDAALDRLHRFLRLRRAIGWRSATLDRAIRSPAVGAGALDDAALAGAVALRDAARRLGATADAVLDLLEPLDPAVPTGTYATVFLDPARAGTVDAALTADGLAATLAAEAVTPGSGAQLGDHLDPLLAALGLRTADGPALLAAAGGDQPLTVAAVSRAHAAARLARALRLPLADLVTLTALSGLDPFASLAGLTAFADLVETVRASGQSPADLAYLLTHDAVDLAAREPAPGAVTDLVTGLATAYAAARAATASPYDPAATWQENAPAVIGSVARLPGLDAAALAAVGNLLLDAWADPGTTEAGFVTAALAPLLPAADVTALQAALAARAAAAEPRDAERNDVLRVAGAAVAALLYRRARIEAALGALATFLATEPERVAVLLDHAHLVEPAAAGAPLLREVVLDDSGTAPATDRQERAVRLLHVMTSALAPYDPDDAVLAWLLDHSEDLGWLRWDALPYDPVVPDATLASWRLADAFFTLAGALPAVVDPLDAARPHTVLRLLELVLAAAPVADVLAELAALSGVDFDTLVALDTALALSTPDLSAYLDPATTTRLLAAADLLRGIGLRVGEAVALAAPAPTAADVAALRSALQRRYAEPQWLGVSKAVQDDLRERKRDALVAYLLATDPTLTDSTDLYDRLLIDVDMAACMPTSRIVQAHATVQLFALRCLMALSPGTVAAVGADDGWAQWEWMSQFRVWEANRKIWLWPELFATSAVRDDRSEIFVELDDQLQQNPVTPAAVQDATAAYLEKLTDIAQLDVMATYYETRTYTLHVFARTKGGDPAVFYHREFQSERYWTPWARVPVDITGDTLVAFDRNGRLSLAWPEFAAEPDPDAQPPDTPDPGSLSGGKANDRPYQRWTIRLAVSERAEGAWRPKRVSDGHLTTPLTQVLPPAEQFSFFAWGFGEGQAITCVGPYGVAGSFALTGCKGYPEPVAGGFGGFSYPRYADAGLVANRFRELGQQPGDQLEERSALSPSGALILSSTPGTFTVTHPLQVSLLDWVLLFLQAWLSAANGAERSTYQRRLVLPLGTLMPWFYADQSRTFAVVPGFYPGRGRPPGRGPLAGPPAVDPATQRKTFSDIHRLVTDVLAQLATYAKKWSDDPAQSWADFVDAFLADPETLRLWAEIQAYQALNYGLRFHPFYHPLVCLLRMRLDAGGIGALMDRDLQLTDTGFDFAATYAPSPLVAAPYPREDVDFTFGGAYSSYNWELFVHLPRDMAERHRLDHQYGESVRYLAYLFDFAGASDAPAPNRYWKPKPFFLRTPAEYVAQRIDTIMNTIAADPTGASISELAFAVAEWRRKPFRPHVVARSRTVAYQQAIVIDTVKTYLEWADDDFRQFTREKVTTATQKYVLVQKMLGRAPRIVPPAVEPPPMTYNQLAADIDLFGNALLDLENLVPDVSVLPHGRAELPPPPPLGESLTSLYFCIPPNEELLALWSTVDDRLTKIRHCRTIDGVEATLSLFSPPIDPRALVDAVAAGMDVSTVVAGLGAPLPHYRFRVMVAKAVELAGQVASLGSELLSALEKRDGEALSRLRARQEVGVAQAVRTVKEAGITEAKGSVEALRRQREVVAKRHEYYAGQDYMNGWEIAATVLAGVSLVGEIGVGLAQLLAGGTKLMPTFTVGAAGFGGSPMATAGWGGENVGGAAESAAGVLASLTRIADKGAGMAATQGAYQRRSDDWELQAELAARELTQLDQQIAVAGLHVDSLTADLAAHDVSAANAAAMQQALAAKYTGQELYQWTVGQVSSVYFQAYKLAHDVAKKAERCMAYELGEDASYIRFGYWDSLHKGLSSHEALLADIRRMDAAYLDRNAREYELTKHVSVADLDPGALITLKATGSVTVPIPELVYDMDHPGHYFRRIRNVSLSLLCNAGPYTTVAATLSLVSNKYRRSTAPNPGGGTPAAQYAEDTGNDSRFAYNVGTMASIATSTAVGDDGQFELNFHDERYLPFEGAGAISTWRIQLPTVLSQIDPATISDVVLHIDYTAREGGSGLRAMVEGSLVELSNQVRLAAGRQGWYAALSVRDAFPDAWWQLRDTGTTAVTVGTERLPYAVRGHHPAVADVTWLATVQGSPATYPLTVDGGGLTLQRDPQLTTLCAATGPALALGDPVALACDAADLVDLVALIHYTIT